MKPISHPLTLQRFRTALRPATGTRAIVRVALTAALALGAVPVPPSPAQEATPAEEDGHDHDHDHEGGPHEDDIVLLDEAAIRNLRLEFADVEEAEFRESVFALGRIEAIPSRQAAVSSRIAGRVAALHATVGEQVAAGSDVATIESRQPGDPPPTVTLAAPIGGLVTMTNVRLGDPVDPDTRLIEITDLAEVHAVAKVPEHRAGLLEPGATRAEIRVAALPDEVFEGELLRFGTSANIESGTIDAVFRLPNPDGLLRAGMRAEFSIIVSVEDGVMSVPREALQGAGADLYVYVRDFDLDNAFIKAPVVVGRRDGSMVEILSGVLPGDTVVTRGAYSLAFAGGGTMSLKEALDAAHGHEHNADGSEMTDDQAADSHDHEGDAAHDHAAAAAHAHAGPLAWFFMATTGILFLLLVAQSVRHRRTAGTTDHPATPA